MKTSCAILVLTLLLSGCTRVEQKERDVPAETKKAIASALAFLVKNQADDGSWGTDHQTGSVGITSFAGLAFLSAGATPGKGGYGRALEKAMRYVLEREDNQIPGLLRGPNDHHGIMFDHGYAALFLADVHEKLTDADKKQQVAATLDRAVKVIVDAQNPEGGWRYKPNGVDADITVTACQVEALCAARNVGIKVPQATLDKAIAYVRNCQNEDGGFRYQPIGGASGFARTAAGLTALNRLGVDDGKLFERGIAFLERSDPKKGPEFLRFGLHFSFGYYYATKAMWYSGDRGFQAWYPSIRDELLECRQGEHWKIAMGCPHYDTAVALIILQAPDARLASMKRGK
jgi:hypothetical protein